MIPTKGNPLAVIHSLCSSYHWDFRAAMRLTMPQIIMLNYESSREYKNAEKRAKAKVERDRERNENDPVYPGTDMRLSELEQDESGAWEEYLTKW